MNPKTFRKEIEKKVNEGSFLTLEEGLFLFETPDLPWLGSLAHRVKTEKNGAKVYYIRNQHINYSNICTDKCKFCAFGQSKRSSKGYQFSLEEIYKKAQHIVDIGGCELHMVGGLHPDLPFEYYLDLLKGLKSRFPKIHLKAFTAVEIDYFAKTFGMSLETVLKKLTQAGLDSLPGGGAEIFDETIRRKLCAPKTTGEEWLEIHRIAHRLGLKTTCTLLYGHIEEPIHRLDHMIRLRSLQQETGGFTTFIPLAFNPANTTLKHIPKASAVTDLKMIAISRLMLPNIQHIKTYWIMVGVNVAQMALFHGADCFDGTVTEERIVHMAGAETPQSLSADDIKKLIHETGHTAVERDTHYGELESFPIPQPGKNLHERVPHQGNSHPIISVGADSLSAKNS